MRLFNRKRRRYASYGERRFSPWIIVAVCAACTLTVTVIVGNLLGLWLDEDTLRALREEQTTSPTVDAPSPDARKPVRANAFSFGESTDPLWENPQVSVLINAPDGTLLYSSPVATHLGYPTVGKHTLSNGFDELSAAASHVSGVFYPRAYLQESADLRYAETAREAALLREFLEAGGNEIVLMGLPWDSETVERTTLLEYVSDLRAILSETPIGVAIPLSVAGNGKNWKLLTRIEEVSDFCLLDLCEADDSRSPEEWLSEYRYFEAQYRMRLLLGAWQTAIIEAASDLRDVQTVTQPPKTEDAPSAPTE